MKKTRDFRSLIQLLTIYASVIIISGFIAILNLILLEIKFSYIWIVVLVLCLLSPLTIYISARIFSHRRYIKDQQSLISYAEYAAKLYKECNNRAIVPGTIMVFSFIACLFFQEWVIIKTIMQVLFAANSVVALFLLTRIHVAWFRYFYVSRKYIDQKSAENLYRDSLEEVRRKRYQYQNYCTARQAVCYKAVRYQGQRSLFLAYQFSTVSEDRMKVLAKHMKSIGYVVKLPPGSEFAELLLCKLCQSILSCRNFIAEVSISNQNVYFELGLAKAFGKNIWLLAFGEISNVQAIKHPLLTAIIRIQESVFRVEDIGTRIENDLRGAIKARTNPSDRRIPIRRFPSLARFESKKVLLVGPRLVEGDLKEKYEDYAKIGEVIRRIMSAKNLETIDLVNNSPSLKYAQIFNDIANSRIVIGLFADEEFENCLNLNCVISYLLGFAFAIETRLLMFQKLPYSKQMLDLHGLIHEITDAEDLEKRYSHLINEAIIAKIPITIFAPPP